MPEDFEVGRTSRGFAIVTFQDTHSVQCSIQESSAAGDGHIWLGCNEANPRHCVKGVGWQKLELPENTVCDTRMHLSRAQAAKLIELLQKFVDTGRIA